MKLNSLMVNKSNIFTHLTTFFFFHLAEASLNDLISEYQQISSPEVVEATADTLTK